VTARAAVAAACVALAACAAGPENVKATLEVPVSWTVDPLWREGRPDDANTRGPWW